MELKKKIAFFVPEVAIDESLHTYAGGLGVVAGSFLRAAKRNKIPVVGVTPLWRSGFYNQKIGANGMEVNFVERHYNELLEDTKISVKIQLGGNSGVVIKVWELKPEAFDTVPIYFLDTDIVQNDEHSRNNTKILYPSDVGQQLAQQIILGIGGVRALQALGIPVDIYHLNEGYTVLVGIELIRQKIAKGLDFHEAIKSVREKIVFTTHTPEMAGSPSYDLALMMALGCFPGINKEQVAYLDDHYFNLTVAGLRLARKANTVSQLHGETANRMWAWVENRCQIISITNGVDVPFWQWPEFQTAKTPEEIRLAKISYRNKLFEYIKQETGKTLAEELLTIVWTRRWADYKRPWLIFYNRDYFRELLKSGTVQIIFAGKPHPADMSMRNLWNEVWRMSQEFPNLVMLPGYELTQSKLLKGGADLWLNTPRRPREACGTSWMSAMMNGTLVLSSRDGGAIEGIFPDNGFLFGVDYPCRTEGEQDARDFEDLREGLKLAGDIFSKDKNHWYKMALAAKINAEEKFSADRMVTDYVSHLYT